MLGFIKSGRKDATWDNGGLAGGTETSWKWGHGFKPGYLRVFFSSREPAILISLVSVFLEKCALFQIMVEVIKLRGVVAKW